ncbi:MAG TPA: DoxX family protein [Gemmatimonadota bacterium]|nr:DoxX family protein [Gemmatimonadota bacterium]
MNDVEGTFPWLLELAPGALLLLRVWIALLFGSSGWSHVTKTRERAESVGMSPAATFALGVAELVGAALLAIGLWDSLAAGALAAVMLGAIYKKAFVWKTGFWGGESQGWYYEVLYVICLLVIATTGGGPIGL